MKPVLLFEIITGYSLGFVLLCVLLGAAYGGILYFRNRKNKDLSKVLSGILFFLRSILVSFLAFFLLSPLLKNVVTEQEKPLIIIAQDNSASLANGKDSAYIKGEYRQNLKKLLTDLSSDYEVRSYIFDNVVKPSADFNLEGKESDYSALFDEIENNFSNRNLGAVIVAGDGLFNKGNNPVYRSSGLKFPIYTIALGDTTPVKDILIKRIDHNQVAYLGNKFPADITIDARKLKGTNATLSINKDGKKLADQKILVNSDNFTQTFSFVFDADKPGLQKYTAFVSYAENEQNRTNNIQSFIIDVIDNREKILILAAAPHPDIAAIKESIEANQNYEVESYLMQDFNKPVKPYSLVILDQVQMNSASSSRVVNEMAANNTPYFLISSNSSDKLPGVNISGSAGKYTDAEAVYDKGFSLFTISDELKNYFRNFPAVKTSIGNYTVANSINTLVKQRVGIVETDNPLLCFNTVNEQKAGMFLGDGLWRWKLRDYADHENHNLFNELISKIVQYLSVKADKSFFRIYAKKIINENEAMEMDAEVYNNSYELINDPEVSIVITNENKKNFNYTFSKTAKGYKLNAGMFPPGEYSYEAKVKIADKLYNYKGMFSVRELVAEKVNTVADHQLMYQLAERSGGKMFYPNQLDELRKTLESKEEIKTITYTQKKLSDLIDIKWIFFLILGLLSLEWFIRKSNGLY
ncbi:MAG: hypothetical protein ACJ76F_05830 [Bacteroidia bacterium]